MNLEEHLYNIRYNKLNLFYEIANSEPCIHCQKIKEDHFGLGYSCYVHTQNICPTNTKCVCQKYRHIQDKDKFCFKPSLLLFIKA